MKEKLDLRGIVIDMMTWVVGAGLLFVFLLLVWTVAGAFLHAGPATK
jgi:hypothetical protein